MWWVNLKFSDDNSWPWTVCIVRVNYVLLRSHHAHYCSKHWEVHQLALTIVSRTQRPLCDAVNCWTSGIRQLYIQYSSLWFLGFRTFLIISIISAHGLHTGVWISACGSAGCLSNSFNCWVLLSSSTHNLHSCCPLRLSVGLSYSCQQSLMKHSLLSSLPVTSLLLLMLQLFLFASLFPFFPSSASCFFFFFSHFSFPSLSFLPGFFFFPSSFFTFFQQSFLSPFLMVESKGFASDSLG